MSADYCDDRPVTFPGRAGLPWPPDVTHRLVNDDAFVALAEGRLTWLVVQRPTSTGDVIVVHPDSDHATAMPFLVTNVTRFDGPDLGASLRAVTLRWAD